MKNLYTLLLLFFLANADAQNLPPDVKGPFAQKVCGGELVCFTDMKLTDPNQGDTVRVKWNYGIPKAKFSKKMVGKYEQWNFCWQTTYADASCTPHFFAVTAFDDGDTSLQSTRNYSIIVEPTIDLKGGLYTYGKCGEVTMEPVLGNQKRCSKYGDPWFRWIIDYPSTKMFVAKELKYTFNTPGKHVIKLQGQYGGQCYWDIYDTVDIVLPQPDLGRDTQLCSGQSLNIKPTISGTEGKVNYFWNNSTTAGADNFTVKNLTADTKVSLRVTDSLGCEGSDEIIIKYFEKADAGFWLTETTPYNFRFNPKVVSYPSYLWDFGDGFSDTNRIAQHTYPIGMYWPSLKVVVNANCFDTLTRAFVAYPTGIGQATQNGFLIYPNPGSGNLILKTSNSQEFRVMLTDLLGKIVLPEQTYTSQNNTSIAVQTSHLPPGIYLVRVSANGAVQTFKWVKQ